MQKLTQFVFTISRTITPQRVYDAMREAGVNAVYVFQQTLNGVQSIWSAVDNGPAFDSFLGRHDIPYSKSDVYGLELANEPGQLVKAAQAIDSKSLTPFIGLMGTACGRTGLIIVSAADEDHLEEARKALQPLATKSPELATR